MKMLRSMAFGTALALVPLALTVGCEKKSQSESTEANDLVKKVAETQQAESQAQTATKAQTEAMAKAGLQTNGAVVPLSQDQRTLLETRVKDEKDNHFAMAVRFLKGHGLSEEKAKTLAARANIMEDLQPGWQVYHQYVGGAYLTAVTQGKAVVGPTEYLHNQRAALEQARDENMAKAKDLSDQVNGLVAEKVKVQEEVDSLHTEKTTLLAQMNDLTTLSLSQKAKLNSLHYLIGQRKQLVAEGVIVVPIFAKDRMGPKALASRFSTDLPLDTPNPEIQIKASDLGLTRISKVNVVPGSLLKDKQYTVTLAEDRKVATIRILDPERMRNDRVVFAVTD